MSDVQIITAADIRAQYPIGKNMDDSRIDPHIVRAQQSDLKPLLGEYLYWEVANRPEKPLNKTLLEGGKYDPEDRGILDPTFLDCVAFIPCDEGATVDCGIEGGIYFAGINQYLIACAYARIVEHNDTFVNRSGNKNKEITESNKQPQQVTNHEAQRAKSDAIRMGKELERYLDHNKADYPLWQVTTDYGEHPQRTGLKISRI